MTDIVVAPFSNSAIRDWPAEHFSELVGLLLDERFGGARILVTGTANQRLRACGIVRPHPADRVVNACGRLSWPDVLDALRGAALVVGNNSGIAHVAGAMGTPTICVFGGSHQRLEWRPRGPNVVVLSRAIACSPCQLDHGSVSPYGKACLREIVPSQVRDAALLAMKRADARQARGMEERTGEAA